MRLLLLVLDAALGAVLLGSPSCGKPLEPCPQACRCFLSEGLKRADCKHVPEWADQQSDAQDVRIVPPRPSAAGHPSALHLTHFEVFPKVLQLSVTNRSVVEIIPSGFHGLHSLQSLDLSHNLLSRFNFKVFLRMPALRRLVLQGNPIVLERNTRLLSSRSLLSLDLSMCNIASIPAGSLDGMPKLTSLSLRGNPIRLNNDEHLLPISTILELDLSACSLKSLPAKALENLQNLRKLYLDGNRLLTIDKGVLPRGLHLLDLSANNIRNVPTGVISSLKNLTRLELSDNPILCTCSLLGMQGWMSRQLVVSEKPVVCAEPAKFKGLPWTKVNELELCQDEESSSNSYSQSESSQESSDVETVESDESSQTQSVEMPPASYEVYTHENIIKHPQPALHLDHVLELKTLDFRINNEINSIQGDQPYSHDILEKDDEKFPDVESENIPASRESLEDEYSEKQHDERSRVSAEDLSGQGSVEQASQTGDDDATEKDAEVFMKNSDTVAMGRSMPEGLEAAGENLVTAIETTTLASGTEPSVVRKEPNELGDFSSSVEEVTINDQHIEDTDLPGPNDPDGFLSPATTVHPVTAVQVQGLHENSVDAKMELSFEDSKDNIQYSATTELSKLLIIDTPVKEHNEENNKDAAPVESDTHINQSEDSERYVITTEEQPVVTSPSFEQDDISSSNSGHVMEATEELEKSNTEAEGPGSKEHAEGETDNRASEVLQTDPPYTGNTFSGGKHPDSEYSEQVDDLKQTADKDIERTTELIAERDSSPSTNQAVSEHDTFAIPTAGGEEVSHDRSDHARRLDFEKEETEVNVVDSGGMTTVPTGGVFTSVEVPVVEGSMPATNNDISVQISNERGEETSSITSLNEKTDHDIDVPGFTSPEFEEASIPEHLTEKPKDSLTTVNSDGDIIEKIIPEQESPGSVIKHSENLAVDNSDSVPSEPEEKKSTVTYIILGCIVLAIVVLILIALVRGKSDKKDGKTPAREHVGTEMKDMMNPLLEPNGDHPEPRRGLLGSLELIREVEEGKSTCGETESPEATSLLKQGLEEEDEGEKAKPESPSKHATIKSATGNGNVAEAIVEPTSNAGQKEANGGPAVNGQAGKHNGIPTTPSKVKVKASVIHMPMPRTPILVNRTNGTRDQV